MKKNEWLIVFLPLLAVWTIDRITKIWAESAFHSPILFGLMDFPVHHNPGIMLGLFSNLPGHLRVVSLSTAGAFILCIYVLVQILLPIQTMKFRAGLSIVVGGIVGNVTDRIIWGHVVDFILIGYGNISTAVFNMADALQWVGYALILYAVFKEGDLIWPENNARKQYWIDRKFQLKYCAILMGVGLGISLVSMVFSYTYLRVTMIELVGINPVALDRFLPPFALVFALISVGCSLGLFTIGKIISHQMAGPLFAFERHVLEMIKNLDQLKADDRPLRLRTKDEFKQLEVLARQIQGTLRDLKEDKAAPISPTSEPL